MPNQKNWCSDDKYSHKGNEIENVTAQFGLQHITKEPRHISNTSSVVLNGSFWDKFFRPKKCKFEHLFFCIFSLKNKKMKINHPKTFI